MKWVQELTELSSEFQQEKKIKKDGAELQGYCLRLYQKEEKWILPAEGLNTLLGFQEKSAPAYAGISEEMIFQLL